MKKAIIIISAFILVGLGAFAVYHFASHDEKIKEKGEIELGESERQEIEAVKTMAPDEDIYGELSSHMYTGTVNYRDLCLVFRPLDCEYPYHAKYECAIMDDDDDPQSVPSLYTVDVNEEMGLNMSHIVGPYDSSLECSYENGKLIINGTTMEEHPLSDIKDQVYYYNEEE